LIDEGVSLLLLDFKFYNYLSSKVGFTISILTHLTKTVKCGLLPIKIEFWAKT